MWARFRWTKPEVPLPRGVDRPTFSDILGVVIAGPMLQDMGNSMGRVSSEDGLMFCTGDERAVPSR